MLNWGFLVIIVYSTEGNKDYKTAEFLIEILIDRSPPTYNELLSKAEESENKTALEINSWPVIINEKAYNGYEETREKWGDYSHYTRIWIEGMEYRIITRILTTDDVVHVVESMSLVAP